MNPINASSTCTFRVPSIVTKHPLVTALVTSVASSCFSYSMGMTIAMTSVGYAASNYFKLVNDLTSWCDQDTSQEKPSRIDAANRIKKCYVFNSRALSFAHLHLTNLPACIQTLSSIQKLNLSYNQLTTLPEATENLSLLQELYLDDNPLIAIPDCIKKLSSLQLLSLYNTRLTEIPDWIGKLTSLRILNLSRNQLTIFPDCIGELTSLRILDLSNNQLTTIPDCIKNLNLLQKFYLVENFITTLPECIGELTSLQIFFLRNNRLNTLPESIWTISSLQTLNLSLNRLTSISDSIRKLTSIKDFHINSNRLTTIPSCIGNLHSLHAFFIENNQLTTIPPTLANLSSKCSVNASSNRLSPVAIQAFQDAIAQTKQLNPLSGPIFNFTIYDTPSLRIESLERILEFWLQKFQIIFPKNSNETLWINRDASRYPTNGSPKFLSFYNRLLEPDDQKKNNLTQFLQRVQETQDFISPRTQGNVVLRVDRMLEGACKNSEFLRTMNWIIEDALSSCKDRVAEAFDQIEIQWKILCDSQNLTDKKLADLVIGLDRINRLNQIAHAKIAEKKLGDAIEVILFFRTKLAKELNLPTSTEGMLYPSMASITTGELEEARKKIITDTGSRNSKIEILCNSELWKDRIREKESEFFEKLSDELNDLSEVDLDILRSETKARIKEEVRRFTKPIISSDSIKVTTTSALFGKNLT